LRNELLAFVGKVQPPQPLANHCFAPSTGTCPAQPVSRRWQSKGHSCLRCSGSASLPGPSCLPAQPAAADPPCSRSRYKQSSAQGSRQGRRSCRRSRQSAAPSPVLELFEFDDTVTVCSPKSSPGSTLFSNLASVASSGWQRVRKARRLSIEVGEVVEARPGGRWCSGRRPL
jgi:hypothetical protein